jgi:putative tricarboxylic transport membrane protein
MIRSRHADIIASVLLIALAVALWTITESFPYEAARVPRLTLGGIILLSFAQLVKTCKNKSERTLSFDFSRILRIILSSLAYAVLINIIGYYAATVLYIFSVMIIFGIRKKILLAAIPIGFVVIIYMVFVNIISIRVPLPFFM